MGILAGFMVPHPPMIVPDVGQGSEKKVKATIDAYDKVAKEIARIEPETIIITSPHATMYSNYFHISPGQKASGSFSDFRAPGVSFEEELDYELVNKLVDITFDNSFPAGIEGERERRLDHGTMVPLYFIRKFYHGGKIVRIGLSGLSLIDHYQLGMYIKDAVNELGRKAVFVASGDLSHKLQDYGPYGYAPEGPVYDERIMDVAGRAAFGEMLDFDEDFCDRAAECGHRSFVIMAGAFDGVDVYANALSHEDITGVGYGVCTFYPKEISGNGKSTNRNPNRCFLDKIKSRLSEESDKSDGYVKLARASLESYIKNGKKLSVPKDIPDDILKILPKEIFEKQAGAFVSIHKNGELRGCIGTIAQTTDSVAEEIVNNAISASTRDPRFEPITEEEFEWLEINVDVLGEPEDIDSRDELDVKRYGVIVSCGYRRGLLLPDLEGVDDVDTQVDIAMRKGGISPTDDYRLQRFEVIRHK
ncbi:MAG: AmmeMemoRadiSam system protein A [Eubacterium sp.]|nr:AmmeMemoRadiSam system protein A [Eubacterium sp.]